MGAYALSVTKRYKNKQAKEKKIAVATLLTLAMLCAVSKAYKVCETQFEVEHVLHTIVYT